MDSSEENNDSQCNMSQYDDAPDSNKKLRSDSIASASEGDDDSENAGERLARSRERNREHARRTRLRKKAQLQALQSRVKELQEESRLLKQTVEECSIASILLGLSGQQEEEDVTDGINDLMKPRANDPTKFCAMPGGKRKRFLSDADQTPQPMELKIRGKLTTVGGAGAGKTQINWKTGVFFDEDGVKKQLTPDELEDLRRERNRMHAKMTRDRKRNFISTIEKTIADLERDNKRMRQTLEKQVSKSNGGTPNPSPSISAVPSDITLVSTDLTLTAAVSVPVSAPVSVRAPRNESATVSPEPESGPLAKQYVSLEKLTATLSPPLPPRKVSESSPRHGFKVIA